MIPMVYEVRERSGVVAAMGLAFVVFLAPLVAPLIRRIVGARDVPSVAVGGLVLPNERKTLYVRTSDDGVHWGSPALVNARGDSSVPQVASGSPGDFRLAWQDDRTGAFNTWYARSTDGGASWGPEARLSDRGSGARHKSPNG
jgi:hypothetical protein